MGRLNCFENTPRYVLQFVLHAIVCSFSRVFNFRAFVIPLVPADNKEHRTPAG